LNWSPASCSQMNHPGGTARTEQDLSIYEVDPLTCPKCQGLMRVISFIENPEVVKKTLKHLGLWEGNPGPHSGWAKRSPDTPSHISIIQTCRFPLAKTGFITSPSFKTTDMSLTRSPHFDPFCNSQPDGTGADIGSDERRELTAREPSGIIRIRSEPMDGDCA